MKKILFILFSFIFLLSYAPDPTRNRRVVLENRNKLIPPPISGYAFWFRADGLVAGASNRYGSVDGANGVSQLNDLGGSIITATQSTGSKQPTLFSSTIGTKNRKAIRFVSANATEFVVNNANALTNNISGITIYVVSKVNTGGTNQFSIFFSTVSSGTARADIRSLVANTWQTSGRRLDADAVQTVAGAASTSAFKILGGAIDYTNSNAVHYENGAAVNTNTSFSTDGSTSAANSASVTIGSAASTNYMNADIGEILVYIGYHDATQVAAVHAWLNNFYGLY